MSVGGIEVAAVNPVFSEVVVDAAHGLLLAVPLRKIVRDQRVRTARSRNILQKLEADRIEAAQRNDIPGNRLTSQRVNQLAAQTREIAGALGVAQNGCGVGQRHVAECGALISAEEKQAIFLDWSAETPPKLIALEEI